MDKILFTEYLLSIGFNMNGAAEVIDRIEHDRADCDDINLYKLFCSAAANNMK